MMSEIKSTRDVSVVGASTGLFRDLCKCGCLFQVRECEVKSASSSKSVGNLERGKKHDGYCWCNGLVIYCIYKIYETVSFYFRCFVRLEDCPCSSCLLIKEKRHQVVFDETPEDPNQLAIYCIGKNSRW